MTATKTPTRNYHMERVMATVERANKYFPSNAYMRAALYCHTATLEGRDNPRLSPRIITPMIVGRAGYGKTSILRQMARDMGIGYREIKLGGYTDIAEVFGMVDKITTHTGRPRTVLALPDWWPDPENNPEDAEGIIVFDDCTRCLPHIFQAVMQLVIDGSYNGLELPEGWSCLTTSNPAGGEYNVMELDPAQSSRMLVMGYTRPVETFHEQCELQDVHEDMKSFWASHPEMLEVTPIDIPKPDDNDRTKMIWNRIYPYMKHDVTVLKMVGNTMYGPGFVSTLLSSLETDQPIDPISVLYNWSEVEGTFKRYISEHRTDLVAATTVRLVAWIETRDLNELEDSVFSNLAHFGQTLPDSDSHNLIQRLCGFNGNDGTRGAKISARMKTTTDENGNLVPRKEPHMAEFANKMREIIVDIKKKLNAA